MFKWVSPLPRYQEKVEFVWANSKKYLREIVINTIANVCMVQKQNLPLPCFPGRVEGVKNAFQRNFYKCNRY